MKERDTTTDVLCCCKDGTALKKLSPKEENREIARDAITNNNMNIDKSKPWSVFGEWYWI
jgi:hypothetical protein